MRYTIVHHGVPLGRLELLAQDELTAGKVEPLPAYAAIRPAVQAATVALRNLGFPGPVADPSSADPGPEALSQQARLGRELGLVDEYGRELAVDFIDLADWPGGDPEVVAFVRFRDAPARVAATPPRKHLGARGGDPGEQPG